MKNPLKREKITLKKILDKDQKRVEGWLNQFNKFRPRIEKLGMMYPDIIGHVDLCISKYITLRNGVKIPDEFLCSCKLLGLRVKEVREKNSYSDKKGEGFYYSIDFEDIIGEECEE